MKRGILYIAMALALILMWGCEKEIEFRGEEVDSKVVMNSMVYEDWNPVMVRLSYSKFFLSNDPIRFIDDAMVRMRKNDVPFVDGRLIEAGTYQFDITPKCGDSLYLEAETQQGEKVDARTYVPYKATVSDIDITYAPTEFSTPEYREYSYTLKFKLNDPKGVKNYYQIRMSMDREDASGAMVGRNTVFFDCDDPFLAESSGNILEEADHTMEKLQFSDDAIDGKDYQVKLTGEFYANFGNKAPTESFHLYMEIISLSKEAYLYLKTVDQSNNRGDNPFSEPVMIYGNVNNGIGIFGAMTPNRAHIKQIEE